MEQELESQLDLLDEDAAEEVRQEAETPVERLGRIRERLGISAPVRPAERNVWVAFEDMEIPGGELVKHAAAAMAHSFEFVEILHPPSLRAPAHPGAKYTVLAGRRRILGLIREGASGVGCNVYPASLTDAQAALITLTENHTRGAAWARDVQAIAELLHVARLTIDDLAALFGRARSGIAELARIAKLPDPLLEQVYAGKLSQTDAKRITRLRASEVDRLAALAAEGGEITPADIGETLRGQWSDGLSHPLASVLDMPVTLEADPAKAREGIGELQGALDALADDMGFNRVDVTSEPEPSPVFSGDWGKLPVMDMLATLAGDTTKPARVRTLAKALQAELERL